MDNVYKVAEKSGNNMFVVSMKEMAYLKRWRQIRRGVEQFLDEASDSDLGEEQLNHTVLHGSLANVNCESMDECSLEHCKHLDDCEVSCHGNEDLSFEKSDSDAVGPSSDEMEEADVVSDMRSDLAQWGLRHGCSRTCINELLDILRKQGHDLPKDVRTLMKTPSTIQITKKCGGDYVYFGIERHLQEVLNDIDTVPNEFSLKINVDGLPLFRSSSTQLWTILCSTDINVPFLVALFCGEKKPSSAAEFLEDFLSEITSLGTTGLSYTGSHVMVKVGAFICDAPARAFLKCIKLHTSYSSCERCLAKGIWCNRVVFNQVDESIGMRVESEFANFAYTDHQVSISPLVAAGLPCINTFVLDYMHLVCLGVMRRILRFLKCGPKVCRISHRQQCEVSEALDSFRSCIPSEFARRPRSLVELDRWKATEYRQFLLYTGVVALRGVVSSQCYNHFLCLMLGITVLLSRSVDRRREYMQYARELLQCFVRQSCNVYGDTFAVYNVHNLLHIVDDAENYNCSLNDISAFPFENYLQSIKKMVKSGNNPAAQIAKRLTEWDKNGRCTSRDQKPAGEWRIAANTRDNCFFVFNSQIAIVQQQLTEHTLRCQLVKHGKAESFFIEPCESSKFDIFFIKSRDFDGAVIDIHRDKFVQKALRLPWKDGYVIVPMVTGHENV
jgi:hypothetical protein